MRPKASSFISTHDLPELTKEFGGVKQPRTKLIGLAEAALSGAPDAVTDRVKLGALKRLLKGIVESQRIEAAAWRWLKPDTAIDRKQLKSMRTKLGLAHMAIAELAERMSDACRAMAEAYPKLSRYIDGRIADLEYLYKEHRNSDEIDTQFELYQRQLMISALNASTPQARAGVETLVPTSIAAAAVEVRVALDEGTEHCPFHANLMTVATYQGTVAGIPAALGALGRTEGAREAARLWAGIEGQVHRVLVVVSETDESHYLGFWIPDIRKNSVTFPGAPRALQTGTGQAVVVDDVPPLPVDDEEAQVRWRRYLSGDRPGNFQGSMFVSLPIFRGAGHNHSLPVGVLNVNVVSDRIWKRAYSRYWLSLATRRASALAITAWHATCLAFDLRGTNMALEARLEMPSLRAPGVISGGLLPPGDDDHEE